MRLVIQIVPKAAMPPKARVHVVAKACLKKVLRKLIKSHQSDAESRRVRHQKSRNLL